MPWNGTATLRKPVLEIRGKKDMTDKPDRVKELVCFPELRKGNIGLVVATQIARYVAPEILTRWHSPEQAWAQTQGQLAWYKPMEEEGEMVQINDLDAHWKNI